MMSAKKQCRGIFRLAPLSVLGLCVVGSVHAESRTVAALPEYVLKYGMDPI